MKRGLNQIWITLLACVLAVLFLMTPIATASEENSPTTDGLKLLTDFGMPYSSNNEVLSVSTFFEDAFGFLPSEAELTFLDGFSEFSLIYNNRIPIDRVSTAYDRDLGRLTVTAAPYSYVAANGATVTWVPKSATLEDRTLTLDGDGVCVFDGILHSADFEISVRYAWEVTLSDAATLAILNAAYSAGLESSYLRASYLEEVARYDREMEAFLAYEAYCQLERDFAQYQEDLVQYGLDLEEYRQYLADYTAYSQQLQLYNDWQQYFAYQYFLENNLEAYAAYQDYLQAIGGVEEKLDVLEKLYVTEEHNWQFYGSLIGTTVTTVLDNRTKLIEAGCNAEDIDAARAATQKLRTLLKEYRSIHRAKFPSKHDKLLARYEFYSRNHKALKEEFAKLYGSLYALFQNPFVKHEAAEQGKLEHFMQFIGQLYMTATALDDGVARNKSWKIYDTYSLSDVVDETQFVEDLNRSNPVVGEMPEAAVPKVEYVEPMEEPEGDPVYRKPTEPKRVDEPDEPTPVTDPATVPKPNYAERPDWTPTEPPMEDCVKDLADMVLDHTLTERTFPDAPCSFTLETTLSRPVSVENKKVIVFYDADHKTVLDTQELEYGETFSYGGEKDVFVPWSDAQYHYTFRAWTLADGTIPSSLVANGDLSLYASYWTETRSYTVTWVLNGETKTERYLYGAMPKSPFITDRESDGSHRYEFSGWDREILPVTGDVTYTGTLTQIPEQFTVTWIVEGREETTSAAYGTLPVYTGTLSYLSEYERCDFVSWERIEGGEVVGGLTSVTKDTTYRAVFRKTPLALGENGNPLAISKTDSALVIHATDSRVQFYEAWLLARSEGLDLSFRWELFSLTVQGSDLDRMMGARQLRLVADENDPFGRIFRIMLRNGNNEEIRNPQFTLTFALHEDKEGRVTTGQLMQNSAWTPLESDSAILPNATLCVPRVGNLTVRVTGDGKANLSELPIYAEAGMLINLGVQCTYGYEISAATVRRANGSVVKLDGLTFQMPADAVEIDLTVSKIVYRVIFRVDGVTVFAHDYYLGDTIVLPEPPKKASSGGFDYTFSEWSPKVSAIAIGDQRTLVYDAVFVKSDSQAADPYLSGNNNNRLLTVFLPIALGVIAVVTVGTVLLVRRRKKRLKAPTPMPEADVQGTDEKKDENA